MASGALFSSRQLKDVQGDSDRGENGQKQQGPQVHQHSKGNHPEYYGVRQVIGRMRALPGVVIKKEKVLMGTNNQAGGASTNNSQLLVDVGGPSENGGSKEDEPGGN